MRSNRSLALALVAITSMALIAACGPTTAEAPSNGDVPQLAAPNGNGNGNGLDTAPGQDPDAGQGVIDPSAPVDPQPATTGTVPVIGSTKVDMRTLRSNASPDKKPAREMMSPPERPGVGPDAAVQTSQASVAVAATPSPWEGMNLTDNGAGWPPDTTGDVGPVHFIQAVNTSMAIYNKSDGTLASGPFTFNTLFATAKTGTPCDTSNQGDPVVLYDQFSGRWIVTDFAWSSLNRGPWYECIAVSNATDSDPDFLTKGWTFYGFTASTTAMNDYPKFGVWNNGIWMTANMFKGGRTYSNAQVWALNREDMLAAKPIRFVTWNMGSSSFSLLPGNLDGSDVSTPSNQYVVSSYGSTTALSMWRFTVKSDWSGGTISSKITIPVASYTKSSGRVPQKDSTETLDALGDRLMYPLQYRGGSLWVSQTVAPSTGHFGIRWWQLGNLDGTPSVTQQSTWAPDTTLERWMPSLAVNGKGEMALIYSASGKTENPSIRLSGQTAGAATAKSSALDISETVLQSAQGAQNGGYNRWGDYSLAAVDPSDNCTFWYTTEYVKTTGKVWNTKFGKATLTSCP